MPQEPKTPSTKDSAHDIAPQESNRAEIDAFLAQVRSAPSPAISGNGRLIFAMDATMSRQPTWDMALQVQAQMFNAVKAVGGLDVKLVFFRGFDECKSSRWVSDATALARLMTAVECRGGFTQIRKVLKHALGEAANGKVSALVYVGDAMEEKVDELANLAGNSAFSPFQSFFSRKATTGGRRRHSLKSRGSRAAPPAASGRDRRRSCASFSKPSPSTRPVDARRLRTMQKAAPRLLCCSNRCRSHDGFFSARSSGNSYRFSPHCCCWASSFIFSDG